ncbi:MAG: hypothetical protein C4308_00695 [Chitinophagaceae bacterium]
MKSIICIFFAALFSVQLYAQRSSKNDYEKENFFRAGLKASLYINKVDSRSFKEAYSYNYGLGGFLQFNFSRKLGLQPEVNFVQATAETSDDYSDIYDDVSLGGSQVKVKLGYLKIAPLLNLNVGPTQKIKLQFGPQWGMKLKEKADSTNRDIFKNGDFSLAGGLMIQLPFVQLGGRYEHGLTNINDIDNRDKWKSQAFQIFAGITF